MNPDWSKPEQPSAPTIKARALAVANAVLSAEHLHAAAAIIQAALDKTEPTLAEAARIAAMEEAAARCDEAAEAYRTCAQIAPDSDVFQCAVETAVLLAAAIRERIDRCTMT